jgi:hypothetical protein
MEKNDLMIKFHNYKEISHLIAEIDQYESIISTQTNLIDSIETELNDSHKKLEKIRDTIPNVKITPQNEEEIKNILKTIKSREIALEKAYRDFDDNKTILQNLKFDYQVALGIGALKLLETNQDLQNSLKNEVRKLIKEKHQKNNQIKSIDEMNFYIDKHFLMELRIARESGFNKESNTN